MVNNMSCKGCIHDKNKNSMDGFKYCSLCDRAYCGLDSGFHDDLYEKAKEPSKNHKGNDCCKSELCIDEMVGK